jgi:DNA (cytosine-5)-methyltransferase 1
VQTFPDWFQFPVPRTHQYRLIGNAVPPLVGEAVGHAVANLLDSAESMCSNDNTNIVSFQKSRPTARLPENADQAIEWIATLASKTRYQLRKLDTESFLLGWHALLYRYPGLHPDSALDHGEDQELIAASHDVVVDLSRRYIRSGWPVALELIGREAWRRYEADGITEEDFYCVDAQRAGFAAQEKRGGKRRYA